MLIPILKHPHSGIDLAWTELQSQGDAFGWVSEGCLWQVGARFRMRGLWAAGGHVCNLSLALWEMSPQQKKIGLTLRGRGRGEKGGAYAKGSDSPKRHVSAL